MLVNFGAGKCPACGDFGMAVEKNIFHCEKCNVSFNDYYISGKHVEFVSKDWN